MRRLSTAFGLAALIALVISSASCGNHGTYLVIALTRSATVTEGIASIDLTLTNNGKVAMTTLKESGSATVSFPTDAVLEVSGGEGAVTVLAIGRDGVGAEVARAMMNGVITKGTTTTVNLLLNRASGDARLVGDLSMKDFGTVIVGMSSAPTTFTVSNTGGEASGPLTVGTSGDGGEFNVLGCTDAVVAPGGTCALTISYEPKAAGTHNAIVSVSGMPGGMVTLSLSGTALPPGAISITPATYAFTTQLVGATVEQTFTLSNTGGVATGNLSVTLTGSDAAQFAIKAGDTCTGNPLAPAGMCSVTVQFTPGTAGTFSASLTVMANPGGASAASLTGSAVTAAGLSFDKASQDLGTVSVGSSSTTMATFTLSNAGSQASGTIATTITGNTSDFNVTDNCATKTLGAPCTYVVTFTPQSYGSKSITVKATGSPGGMPSFTVTGTGRDTVQLSASVSGTGTGTITGGGLNCGNGNTTCSVNVTRTTSAPAVMLTATAIGGSTFNGWGNDCSTAGTTTTCTVNMTMGRTVSASWTAPVMNSLTVTNKGVAGASGTVTSNVGGINCGGTCSANYTQGASVNLTATRTTPATMDAVWGGACAGFANNTVCTVTMSAARAVTVTFRPNKNIMFVTSTNFTVTGNMGGQAGGDTKCASAASAGGLPGTYKAWLSSESQTAAAHLQSFNASVRGWVRPDGVAFADTLATLHSNGPLNAPTRNETNGDESGTGIFAVKTGTNNNGTIYAGNTCTSWSTTTGDSAVGNLTTTASWSTVFTVIGGCSSPSRLYCFEVDYANPVP